VRPAADRAGDETVIQNEPISLAVAESLPRIEVMLSVERYRRVRRAPPLR
jgi:hypothetical protein